MATQDTLLDRAAALVAPGGAIAYATCSLLAAENRGRVEGFHLRHPRWTTTGCRRITPLEGGDGFGLAVLRRAGEPGPGGLSPR